MKMPVYLLDGKEITHRELYLWLARPERLDAVTSLFEEAAGYGQVMRVFWPESVYYHRIFTVAFS